MSDKNVKNDITKMKQEIDMRNDRRVKTFDEEKIGQTMKMT